LRVVGDLSGPEIDGALTRETVPNEPFRIPRLRLKGEYRLENIRLVQGEALLAFAEPRSAAILVTQVLVTRVTSRALTLDEIRSHGIVFDEEGFQAFNFTFGFAVDGETVHYEVPVVLDRVHGVPAFLGGEWEAERVIRTREFAVAGVLEGMPEGPRPVRGTARGALLVRDPTLGVTLTHPNVVRGDEEYSLLLTVSNTGNVPANLVTFAFDLAGLSGVTVVGAAEQTIESLPPDESELLEFRLRSLRTGRVVATAGAASPPPWAPSSPPRPRRPRQRRPSSASPPPPPTCRPSRRCSPREAPPASRW
jgi:hypothetical protein